MSRYCVARSIGGRMKSRDYLLQKSIMRTCADHISKADRYLVELNKLNSGWIPFRKSKLMIALENAKAHIKMMDNMEYGHVAGCDLKSIADKSMVFNYSNKKCALKSAIGSNTVIMGAKREINKERSKDMLILAIFMLPFSSAFVYNLSDVLHYERDRNYRLFKRINNI